MAKNKSISSKKKAVSKSVAVKKIVAPKKKQLTIMVSSTVYGAESDLDQIAAILRQQFGYKVIMSKEGSVYVSMKHISNTKAACLKAVNDCDLFFGIIFPRYGSGITHDEFLEAKRLDKPRWFIAHEKIEFLRKLLQPKMYSKSGKRKKFEIPKTSVLDSVKVVDMYNDVKANWVQSFSNMEEVKLFIETQFGDMKKRIKELEELKKSII
ncbi:MAG: DUF4062 domain-containing protein [Bacteroidia bacterium]|nr:DUF4062 domain-containing protein [Bacteroidia bacterium]